MEVLEPVKYIGDMKSKEYHFTLIMIIIMTPNDFLVKYVRSISNVSRVPTTDMI